MAFHDVFIWGINNQSITLETYHKSTYMGLLLNFKIFTSLSFKIKLIKCLIDKSFKIYSNWNSFHNDLENVKYNVIKNEYSLLLIDKAIKKYFEHKSSLVTKINKKTYLRFISLNHHISTTFCTIFKIKFQNFAKNFVKKISTFS